MSTSLVGRRRELAELRTLLRQWRLLTLTGPAGVGKTRLAVELADGAPIVELAVVRNDEQVARAVATAVEVPDEHGMALVDAIVAALGRRKVLLVLDNCEHLVGAVGTLTATLLSRCPQLRVLATSREPLQVPGEITYPLGGLSCATELFLERVPGIEADHDEIAELCERLDNLPLAIELAAARARLMPVAEITARLDDRLSLLTGLRAAIEWSHHLLTPAEQVVFRRLSLFPGGFGFDAAEAVCAADELVEIVVGLAAKSLIIADDGTGRFRMLESIRLYGKEMLAEAGEEEQTFARLTGWLTDTAAPLLDSHVVEKNLYQRLCDEYDNLSFAVERMTGGDDERQLLLLRTMALAAPVADRAHLYDLIQCALDRTDRRSVYRCLAYEAAARLLMRFGVPHAGVPLAEEATRLARQNCNAALGRILRLLGMLLDQSGDIDGSISCHQEAVRFGLRHGDPLETANSQHYLGWTALTNGELDLAAEQLNQAMSVIRPRGTPYMLACLLHSVGAVALVRGDDLRAADMFTEAMTCGSDDFSTDVTAIEGLAIVAIRSGATETGLCLAAAARAARAAHQLIPATYWAQQLDQAVSAGFTVLPDERAVLAYQAGRGLDLRYAMDQAFRGATTTTELSARQSELVVLVARGMTNKEIAVELGVSPRTVEAHIGQIKTRLGLKSRAHIAAWTARNIP